MMSVVVTYQQLQYHYLTDFSWWRIEINTVQSEVLVALSFAALPLSLTLTPITAPIFTLAAHFKVEFADYQEGGYLTDD